MWIRRAVATAWVLCLAVICWDLVPDKAQADFQPAASVAPDWVPPAWHPTPASLEAIAGMGGRVDADGPRLSSRAVFVYDLESGEALYERAADDRRPVASLTKLVSSLAMASEPVDLEAVACIDKRFWPNRSGARSKLSTGECYRGWDLLGAALVASDNRGAFGLQVLSGLDYVEFIGRMDEVSASLGMSQSTWADPSGLEDENLSTARDMARAAVAVAMHPALSIAASARSWRVERVVDAEARRLRTPGARLLGSTNRLLGRSDLEVLAGKTGYTDTAGYCFSGVLRTPEGHLLAVSVLGAPRSSRRWTDLARIIEWADGRASG